MAAPPAPVETRAAAASAPTRVNLVDLLAVSAGAAAAAGAVVREVAADERSWGVVDKGDADAQAASGDSWADPQTVADRRAQRIILRALALHFPGLAVVAEEEEEEAGDATAADKRASAEASSSDAASAVRAAAGLFSASAHGEVPLDELCAWVDPLDGTKEFTRRNFDAVTVLVGVSRRGEPVGGVVGRPFCGPTGSVAWGCAGVGCFGVPRVARPPGVDGLVLVCSAKLTPEVTEVERVLAPAEVLAQGATGNKMLRVLEGRADVFVLCTPGTYRWDTCAVQALIEAAGGALTDRNGVAYRYEPGPHDAQANDRGVVAWGPAAANAEGGALVDRVLDATAATSPAAAKHVLRCVDGTPMSAAALVAMLREGGRVDPARIPADVLSVAARETTLVCGRHSAVARVVLRVPPSTEEGVAADSGLIRDVFVKRCVVADLLQEHPRPPEKLARDARSYNNEAVFYSKMTPMLRSRGGLALPEVYFAHVEWDQNSPERSRFLTIVEPLSHGYEQVPVQTRAHTLAALAQLARLHAFCYRNDDVMASARAGFWERGGFWSVATRRSAMPGELEAIAERFEDFCDRFVGADPVFSEPRTRRVSSVLQAHAERVGRDIDRLVEAQGTVIHGDAKNANVFFRRRFDAVLPAAGATPGDNLQASLIDFQWTGPGLGAQDVAYALVTSASRELLDTESELLDFYLGSFNAHAAARCMEPLSREQFAEQYELAFFDYARMLFAYMLKTSTPESVTAAADSFNVGLYKRRLDNLVWLVHKTRTVVESLEARWSQQP